MTFTPTDTTDYTTATATVQLVVNQAVPTVSAWPTASAIASGQALSASTLTGGTASVPGTFAWTAPSTIPAVGTDSEGVAFTPTDATDYQVVVGSIAVVVNPTTPQITAFTPRYMVSDWYVYVLPTSATYWITCAGCQNGDIVHDVSGMFSNDITLSLASGVTNYGLTVDWQPESFEPWFLTLEMQHPGGAYGNQWATAFLGTGSQSTLAVSKTTGTLFQLSQKDAQTYWKKSDSTTGTVFPTNVSSQAIANMAIDDTQEKIVYASSAGNVVIYNPNGIPVCGFNANMSSISSVAARGGYMVFTDRPKTRSGGRRSRTARATRRRR